MYVYTFMLLKLKDIIYIYFFVVVKISLNFSTCMLALYPPFISFSSMFVLLKGRSVEEAFKIGKEIASAVTAMNPEPVTLKLEKVYQPCFLLTKKRYVGYSYENPDQKAPTFDAKGIETVRRDTCPAVAKILEKSLRIMFEHHDITEVFLFFFVFSCTVEGKLLN